MCGISGIMSSGDVNKSDLIEMNRIIRHRGPDDEGFVVFDKDLEPEVLGGDSTCNATINSTIHYCPTKNIKEHSGDFSVAFGHRRLSILDLSPAGHMPMCDPKKDLWITYNGEVYNYVEIRVELEELGHKFFTNSDTEVILHAYKEWGAKSLDRFMGMFAIAILDVNKRELFLARDRFGIKPLYYWVSGSGEFYFGSEIKQFTVIKEWNPKLNHQRAFDYLFDSKTDHTNETMFKGVYQVSPGYSALIKIDHCSMQSDESIEVKKWYKPETNAFEGTFEEAKKIFKDKFYQSVNMHLRADVKVGCTLSGGLDSSSITCVVNDLLKEKGKAEIQQTFSAVDGYSKYSEKKWIDVVVNERDLQPHYITPDPEEILAHIDDIIFNMDEPIGSLSPYMAFLVDRSAKENEVTVLLNGQGADEYLGGYGAFRKIQQQKALDSLNLRQIKKEYGCTFSEAIKLASRSLFRQMYIRVFPKSYNQRFGNRLDSKSWFDFLDYNILNVEVDRMNNQISHGVRSLKDVSQDQLTRSPLPMFLRWEDRNSMIHSIEARVPFLDHRLVEFCHSLPVGFVDTPQKTKRILFEAMKGVIPDKIYHRKDKMGYIAPEERWVKEEHTQVFRNLLQESIACSKGILKPETMEYFEKIITSKEKFNYAYWRLIMFGHWVKVFKVNIK